MNKERINSFPISSKQEYMKNKKMNYLNYCILIYFSNYQNSRDIEEFNDPHRYIYEDKVMKNKDVIEEYSKTKIQTFVRNVKKLANLSNGDIISVKRTNEGKIVYTIKKTDKYILIEEKILRILINFCTQNAIKTYVFLKWKCRNNGCIISRREICENIGISSTGERQLQEITDITKGLQKLGLIKRVTTTSIGESGSDYNKCTYYELVPFEKWQEYWESDSNPNKI